MSCHNCNNSSCSGCCNQTPLRYKGPDIDCLGILSCSTYDSILELLANELCDLQELTGDLNGIDHVSFTSSTGTPSSSPNLPCETDTYTIWADVSETISLGTFTVLNPCDGINYAQIAWVDLDNGNDATGQAGRFDLPFLTVNAALAASPNVHLRQGEYTETIVAVDDMHIYAEPGVIFTAGGLIYSGSTVISGSFVGYARFLGSSIPFQILNTGRFRFECDHIDNTTLAFYVAGNAELVAHVNYIICEGETAAYINSFRDDSIVELHIKEFCQGYYSPYFFRGQTSKDYKGRATIYCPITTVLQGGIYGAIRKSVLNIDISSNANISVVGTLECTNSSVDTTDAGCVRYGINNIAKTYVEITGDIIGGREIGIYNGYLGNLMDLSVKGNVTSILTNPITTQNPSAVTVDIVMRFFNSIIQGKAPTVIGQGNTVYFYNCSFYNSTTDNDVIDFNDTGANNVTAYFYNCVGEGTGGGSFIADNMTGYSEVLGLSFSNSNKAIVGTLTDTWGGFAQIASLVVPKLV